MNKPVLVFSGNCQAANLVRLLSEYTEIELLYLDNPFTFMRSVPPGRILYIEPKYLIEFLRLKKSSGGYNILIEQTTPRAPLVGDDLYYEFDCVYRFPHVEIQAYFPHLFGENTDVSPFDVNRFNRLVRRRFEIDMTAIAKSTQRAHWNGDLVEFIRHNHTQARLFHSFNHPGEELCVRLYSPILAALCDLGGITDQQFENIISCVVAEGGIGFLSEHPLRSRTLRALDLAWDQLPWYSLWVASIEAASVGDLETARERAFGALQLQGCDPHVWYSVGCILEAMRSPNASVAYAACARRFPDNPAYAEAWIRAAGHGSNADEVALSMRLSMQDRSKLGLR